MSDLAKHALELALAGKDDLTSKESGQVESIMPHLNDAREPAYEVKTEKPWHRTLAYMLLQGISQKECAKQFSVSQGHIAQLRKQEWFKRIVEQLADIHFGGDLFGLLEGAAFDAVTTLHELTIGSKSESIRQRSAAELLRQYLNNKPPAPPKESTDPQKEVEQLDEEIKRYEAEELNHKLT